MIIWCFTNLVAKCCLEATNDIGLGVTRGSIHQLINQKGEYWPRVWQYDTYHDTCPTIRYISRYIKQFFLFFFFLRMTLIKKKFCLNINTSFIVIKW